MAWSCAYPSNRFETVPVGPTPAAVSGVTDSFCDVRCCAASGGYVEVALRVTIVGDVAAVSQVRSEILRLECKRCRHHALAVWRRMCCTSRATHSRVGRHAFLQFDPFRPHVEGTVGVGDAVRLLGDAHYDGDVVALRGAEGYCDGIDDKDGDLHVILSDNCISNRQPCWVDPRRAVPLDRGDEEPFAVLLDVERGQVVLAWPQVHARFAQDESGEQDGESYFMDCSQPQTADSKKSLAQALVSYVAAGRSRHSEATEWTDINFKRNELHQWTTVLLEHIITPFAHYDRNEIQWWRAFHKAMTAVEEEAADDVKGSCFPQWMAMEGKYCSEAVASAQCNLHFVLRQLAQAETTFTRLERCDLETFRDRVLAPSLSGNSAPRGALAAHYRGMVDAVRELISLSRQRSSSWDFDQEQRAWKAYALAAKAEAQLTSVFVTLSKLNAADIRCPSALRWTLVCVWVLCAGLI